MAETSIDLYQPDATEYAAMGILIAIMPEVRFYYEKQNNAETPPGVYGTLRVLSRRDIGNRDIGEVDDDGIQDLRQVTEGTMTVRVFGGAARQHLDNLRLRVKKPTSRDIMHRDKFIITDCEPVIDVEVKRDNMYFEPCAVLDMKFRYCAMFSDNVGLIEHVNVNGTIADLPVSFDIDILNPGA